MLVVRFCGGLGNQMFEYAFCVKLKKAFPECIVKTDLRDYRVTKYHYGYELDKIFQKKQNFEEASWTEIRELRGDLPIVIGWPASKISEPLRKMLNKTIFSLKSENILEEEQVNIWKLQKLYGNMFRERDFYLHGCWTGINKYIDEMETLVSDFRFPDFSEERNRVLREEMEQSESVSIHVRRGDYIGTVFDVLTLDYYKEALSYIKKRTSAPRYYFFSDDVSFIEENFSFLSNKKIINWNRGKNSWKDMQLMSCCRHNIIANSTFSQWGALLNRNQEKIVVYPGKEKKAVDMERVMLQGWHRIEV